MKKLLLVIAAAALFVVVPSCKKGENDPFFSLKSRKARLVGEYEMAAYTYKIIRNNVDGSTADFSSVSDSETGLTVNVVNNVGDPTETSYEYLTINHWDFTIRKDGTWESDVDIVITKIDEVDGAVVKSYTSNLQSILFESGTWSFLGGQVDEFKNKERVMFTSLIQNPSGETTTVTEFQDGTSSTDVSVFINQEQGFAEGVNSEVYAIDQLKKDEIILTIDESYTYTESETDAGAISILFSVVAKGETVLKLVAK
ncbi:MAG: hypothetical protein ACI8ZM_000700 [Crocinitomix sp.]|jgi:hypothetical protein